MVEKNRVPKVGLGTLTSRVSLRDRACSKHLDRISLVAEGLDWQPGDNVVVPSNEFPSNLLPWKNLQGRGIDFREVKVNEQGEFSVESILEAMDSRTRLVSVSWVGFSTGYRCNLDEICEAVHRRGALFFVDAIQGMGVFPLDLSEIPIDFLAADGHKWMLGPEGAGMLFVREKHLERLRMTVVGWGSVPNAGQFSRKMSVGRIKPADSKLAHKTWLG